ncbi:hypothetical protein Tco_0523497 [Tanacetum coccineum]
MLQKFYNDPNMFEELKEIYKTLEARFVHEGRAIDITFYQDMTKETLESINRMGFECLFELDEEICPRFVMEFYKTLRLDRYLEDNRLFMTFDINGHEFNISLDQFVELTSHPNQAILSGADNRPPMLEKDIYDSWKSRMELYMMNRQHGRMILESVENGPLFWPIIEENGVTRPRKYSELTPADAIQADCDVKATNIILQRLPPEVYALVSNHRIAKGLWEIIQLLMQGNSLTK